MRGRQRPGSPGLCPFRGSKLARMRRVSWRHFPALLVSAVFLAPLVYMVAGSLRKAGLPPPRSPELIPSPLAWGNYDRAFELVDIPRYALNSLIVAAFAVPLSVLFASWAGFAIARLSPRLRTTLIALSLVALMVPVTALLGMSPFYVLIFYWAFSRIPEELYEAARLEGLSPLQTWRRVAMPLVRPVTLSVALL